MNHQRAIFVFFFFVFSLSIDANTSNKLELGQNVRPGSANYEGGVDADLGALIFKRKTAYLKNGCGFRKALGGLVKVYEICMNLKMGKASDWEKAFTEGASHAFLLTLDFKRGVGGKKVSKAFRESFDKYTSSGDEESAERERFVKWVSSLSVKKKDVFDLLFNDSGKSFRMLYEKNSQNSKLKVFESDNVAFSKSVAKIWLGEHGISEEIKKNLLK